MALITIALRFEYVVVSLLNRKLLDYQFTLMRPLITWFRQNELFLR